VYAKKIGLLLFRLCNHGGTFGESARLSHPHSGLPQLFSLLSCYGLVIRCNSCPLCLGILLYARPLLQRSLCRVTFAEEGILVKTRRRNLQIGCRILRLIRSSSLLHETTERHRVATADSVTTSRLSTVRPLP